MDYPIAFNNYREKDVVPEEILQKIEKIRRRIEKNLTSDREFTDFSDVIYLNSSDPLSVLNQSLPILKGKSVRTVAGSGEFAEVFLNHGVQKLDIFDISFQALFFGELRLAALRNLDFSEYGTIFSDEMLFHSSFYLRLRKHLSFEAQFYFDELLKQENEALLARGPIGRIRRAYDGTFPHFIRDEIRDSMSYKRLQENARQANVSFSCSSVHHEAHCMKESEITYLSNLPELMLDYNLIKDFLINGTNKVIFTMGVKCKDESVELVSDQGSFKLKMGDIFKLGGMNARLMGFDANIPFEALVELRAEDNRFLGL